MKSETGPLGPPPFDSLFTGTIKLAALIAAVIGLLYWAMMTLHGGFVFALIAVAGGAIIASPFVLGSLIATAVNQQTFNKTEHAIRQCGMTVSYAIRGTQGGGIIAVDNSSGRLAMNGRCHDFSDIDCLACFTGPRRKDNRIEMSFRHRRPRQAVVLDSPSDVTFAFNTLQRDLGMTE